MTEYLFEVLWKVMQIGVNSLILDTACYTVCPHLALDLPRREFEIFKNNFHATTVKLANLED